MCFVPVLIFCFSACSFCRPIINFEMRRMIVFVDGYIICFYILFLYYIEFRFAVFNSKDDECHAAFK